MNNLLNQYQDKINVFKDDDVQDGEYVIFHAWSSESVLNTKAYIGRKLANNEICNVIDMTQFESSLMETNGRGEVYIVKNKKYERQYLPNNRMHPRP